MRLKDRSRKKGRSDWRDACTCGLWHQSTQWPDQEHDEYCNVLVGDGGTTGIEVGDK